VDVVDRSDDAKTGKLHDRDHPLSLTCGEASVHDRAGG